MKLYLVGGQVRDHMMGTRPGKDFDFAVEADSYDEMRAGLIAAGVHIWQERPQFVTIRGRIPLPDPTSFGNLVQRFSRDNSVDADFTLCRAEAQYSDGRHPDKVTPSTLIVDLSRRDFTVNAVAVSEDGTMIDPFGGQHDADRRILKCVGFATSRFFEDPLRMLRAIRFAVRYKMILDKDIVECLESSMAAALLQSLPVERVREELGKALSHDWLHTITMLTHTARPISESLARNFPTLWLKATTEDH